MPYSDCCEGGGGGASLLSLSKRGDQASPAQLSKTATLKGSLYIRDMALSLLLLESDCLYYRQWTSQ